MKKKSLLLSLCLVLAFATAVAGTIAFLTDTAVVTNTFTVGNVEIELDETPVDVNGKPVPGERVQGNEYHLVPGKVYTKDPTVTVKAGSDEVYVRVLMTVTDLADLKAIFGDAGFELDKWLNGTLDEAWGAPVSVKEDAAQNAFVWEFRYKEPVDASDSDIDIALEALFTQIMVPDELNTSELKLLADMKIELVAHAIQSETFETAEEAWAAFDEQNGPAAGSGAQDNTEETGSEGDQNGQQGGQNVPGGRFPFPWN